ncbi:uncharacterized protein LOC131216879 [Magnolia sinica]|uniref:uncharacterized protein LOC131216879 n=1 Tax=Magnolia sinica TaxID=86752 RepID=UPI0026595E9B|nr:uncharacterized protein LOC131216879 [Magnolia sinica]
MEKVDLKLGLNQIHTGVVFGFGRFWVPPTLHGPYRQFGSLQHALDLAAVSSETQTGGFGLKMDLAVQHVLLIHSRDVKDGGNCYYDTSKVTYELIQKILLTGLEPGAVDVFLDFIYYSGGPLPDELLTQVKGVHVSEDFVAEQLRSMISDM